MKAVVGLVFIVSFSSLFACATCDKFDEFVENTKKEEENIEKNIEKNTQYNKQLSETQVVFDFILFNQSKLPLLQHLNIKMELEDEH